MRGNQFKRFCTIKASVGSYVYAESWGHGSLLLPCDDWDMADFRLEGNLCQPAVKVEVTGRTIQYPFNTGPFVRCKITFIADKAVDWYTGEMVGEDTVVRGWLKVDNTSRTYKENSLWQNT